MGPCSTQIYLIRHGETASNAEGRFRGRADIRLNENGRKQSADLSRALRNHHFDAIYSSPLSRATETAGAIAADRDMKVVANPGFNNIDLGGWTDRPKADIQREYPVLWRQWITVPERMTIPGGEGILAVQERAYNALRELIERNAGGNFAIVSHRAVLKPLVAAMLGIPVPFFWKIHLDTAGFTIFEHDDSRGFTLFHFNVTHHLGKFVHEKV